MKRILALLIAAALLFSLAACGGSGKNGDTTDGGGSEAGTAQDTTSAAAGTADTEEEKAVLQEQIVGNWTFYNWMYKTTSNHLVFNADGTGSYQGGVVEDGKYEYDYTFTYTISVEPNENLPNMVNNKLHIQYNEVDDSEDRLLSFIDGKMYLAYGDSNHWIIQYDEYTREEDIPQP